MKVLLVCNDIGLSVALQILLREEPGCAVVGSVSNVGIAVLVLEKECPDLIVLEWDLPENNASELLLASKTATYAPRVIVVAKYAGDEGKAMTSGAESFVVKGESPENLITAIHSACRLRQEGLGLFRKEIDQS